MGAQSPAPFACDATVDRIYLGNSLMGYVVAYRSDGRELWRLTVPNFESISGLPNDDRTTRGWSRLIAKEGGILSSRFEQLGSNFALAYRVRERFRSAIIHRSGVIVGTIGPWDGVLVGKTEQGWVFDGGGDRVHGYWKLPTEELTIEFTGRDPELLIEHFLAWNLPQPADTAWVWRKCDGENRFVRLALGKRFDPQLDEAVRAIHNALGPAWAAKIAGDDAMASVLARGDRPFAEWKAAIRTALLDAGADVDCVAQARTVGLLDASLR